MASAERPDGSSLSADPEGDPLFRLDLPPFQLVGQSRRDSADIVAQGADEGISRRIQDRQVLLLVAAGGVAGMDQSRQPAEVVVVPMAQEDLLYPEREIVERGTHSLARIHEHARGPVEEPG